MNPLNCDDIDPMHFLSWDDKRNHDSGVCVESADLKFNDLQKL